MSFVFKVNCLSVSTSILSYTIKEMLYVLPTLDIKNEKIMLKRNSYLFTIFSNIFIKKNPCKWTYAVQTCVVQGSTVHEKMDAS